MEQFKFKPDGVKKMSRFILIKTIPILVLLAAGSIIINYYINYTDVNKAKTTSYSIVIIMAVLGFAIYRSNKKQQQLLESYTLTLDEEGIIREQFNTPRIVILYQDLVEIVKNSNGGITIKGGSALNAIGVPPFIDQQERLEALLSERKQIIVKTKTSFLQKFLWVGILLMLATMATVYTSNNKILVAISGTFILALMGYSLYVTQVSKNIDNRTKKGMWLSLLVILSVILVMYIKLTK
jgi:hypothetical protein